MGFTFRRVRTGFGMTYVSYGLEEPHRLFAADAAHIVRQSVRRAPVISPLYAFWKTRLAPFNPILGVARLKTARTPAPAHP